MKLVRWLNELSDLPADSPEWDHVPRFIADLQEIYAEKLKDRDAGRETLQRAITTLLEECADVLDKFKWADCAEWGGAACHPGEAMGLAEQVREFNSALKQYANLRYSLNREMDDDGFFQGVEQLSPLRDYIIRQHDVLAGKLARPPQEPQDESPVEDLEVPVAPGAETPGTDTQATSSSPKTELGPIERPELTEQPEPEDELEPTTQPTSAGQSEAAIVEPPDERPGATIQAPAQNVTPAYRPTEPSVKTVGRAGPEARPRPKRKGSSGVQTAISTAVANSKTNGDAARTPVGEVEVEAEQERPRAQGGGDIWQVPGHAIVGEPAEPAVNWPLTLWEFIEVEDLPAAFWLAMSMRVAGHPSPVSPALLAAVLGARWIASDTDPIYKDLLEIVSSYEPGIEEVLEFADFTEDVEQALSLLRLAACLRPILIAPRSGLLAWLRAPEWLPALSPLVGHIAEFANTVHSPIYPAELRGAASDEQREAAIADAALKARDWWNRDRGFGCRASSEVWRRLCDLEKGALTKFLTPVADNSLTGVAAVKEMAEQFQDEDYVDRIIDDAYNEWRAGGQLQGDKRRQIIRQINAAVGLAEKWCEAVERRDASPHSEGYVLEQALSLRTKIQDALPEAEAALQALRAAQPAASPLSASAHCLLTSLSQLNHVLNLPPSGGSDAWTEHSRHDWLVQGASGLDEALGRQLWLLPEVRLDDDGRPIDADWPAIAGALRAAREEGRAWQAAFAGWLEKRDFRYAQMLAEALADGQDSTDWRQRYNELLAESRVELQKHKLATAESVERAFFDGILDESERSDYIGHVEAVRVEDELDFAPVLRDLADIRQRMDERRRKDVEAFRRRWEELDSRLAVYSQGDAPTLSRIRQAVEAAVAHSDLRALVELFNGVNSALSRGIELKELEWGTGDHEPHTLREFQQAAEGMLGELCRRGIDELSAKLKAGDQVPQLGLHGAGGDEKPGIRDAALAILNAWVDLKLRRQDLAGQHNYQDKILSVLNFLGYAAKERWDKRAPVETHGESSTSDLLHATVNMDARDKARPIPHFGSGNEGQFDLLCFWARPQVADKLDIFLRDFHSSRGLLVLYLGPLSEGERLEIARLARNGARAIAVLDEKLLLFLIGETERLSSFLQCALPYSGVIPYVQHVSYAVEEEMFFGRGKMIEELWRKDGASVVYGGRQLGKSALLGQVERKYHRPERQQYVWVENMLQSYGLQVGRTTDYVWHRLRDRFNAERLFTKGAGDGKKEVAEVRLPNSDDIYQRILREIRDNQRLQVMFLLDEVDEFLYADSKDNFRVVSRLISLMRETNGRFKVVFAGNYNVQRFKDLPNQPLTNMKTLRVGAMERHDAHDLVSVPLKTLGYVFKDENLVLRILSYTNYHAGLIQIFGHHLLKRMHGYVSGRPPYTITQGDVDAVYRDIGANIRERFNMTLVLDAAKQYEAITLAMIVHQSKQLDWVSREKRTFARAYEAHELLTLVRDTYQIVSFGDISIEQMGVRLDEMVGLGVLIEDSGRFSLRSPNLVRLIGSEREIESRLQELKAQKPGGHYYLSYHSWLENKATGGYSPLTYEQDRLLNHSPSGVGLIFASEAQGAGQIEAALSRYIPEELREGGRGVLETIPPAVTGPEEMDSWLKQFRDSNPNKERLVALYRVPAGSDPSACVEAALEFHKGLWSKKRWVRTMFLFDARAAWDWMRGDADRRARIERRAGGVVSPPLWDDLGVRQRLFDMKKVDTGEAVRAVLRATGGWPWLLDWLFGKNSKAENLSGAAGDLERDLGTPRNELADDFLTALGVQARTLPWSMLRVLQGLGQIKQNEMGELTDFVAMFPTDEAVTVKACELAVEYLKRMNCVAFKGDSVLTDPVVKTVLPPLPET